MVIFFYMAIFHLRLLTSEAILGLLAFSISAKTSIMNAYCQFLLYWLELSYSMQQTSAVKVYPLFCTILLQSIPIKSDIPFGIGLSNKTFASSIFGLIVLINYDRVHLLIDRHFRILNWNISIFPSKILKFKLEY